MEGIYLATLQCSITPELLELGSYHIFTTFLLVIVPLFLNIRFAADME